MKLAKCDNWSFRREISIRVVSIDAKDDRTGVAHYAAGVSNTITGCQLVILIESDK